MSDRLVPGWLVAVVGLIVAVMVGSLAFGPAIQEVIDEVAELAPDRTAPAATAAPPATGAPQTGPPTVSRSFGPDELGRIQFGIAPGPDPCSVDAPVDAPIKPFPAGEPIYVSAILREPVATADGLVLLYTTRGGEFESVQQAQDPAYPSWWSNLRPIGPLEPGVYAFTILGDIESQAEGVLQVE